MQEAVRDCRTSTREVEKVKFHETKIYLYFIRVKCKKCRRAIDSPAVESYLRNTKLFAIGDLPRARKMQFGSHKIPRVRYSLQILSYGNFYRVLWSHDIHGVTRLESYEMRRRVSLTVLNDLQFYITKVIAGKIRTLAIDLSRSTLIADIFRLVCMCVCVCVCVVIHLHTVPPRAGWTR